MSEDKEYSVSTSIRVPKWSGETSKWKVFEMTFKAALRLKKVRKIWSRTP
jgi:hypothetical protein